MIELTREPIDAARLLEAVRDANAGGVVLFLGTVREMTGDERTLALEYEAHEPMAKAKMTELEREARQRWPIRGMAMIHRLGRLEIGDVAVGIAISCPHRAEAFDACEFAIDRLKEIVPIWKKDLAPDGRAEWKHPAP